MKASPRLVVLLLFALFFIPVLSAYLLNVFNPGCCAKAWHTRATAGVADGSGAPQWFCPCVEAVLRAQRRAAPRLRVSMVCSGDRAAGDIRCLEHEAAPDARGLSRMLRPLNARRFDGNASMGDKPRSVRTDERSWPWRVHAWLRLVAAPHVTALAVICARAQRPDTPCHHPG